MRKFLIKVAGMLLTILITLVVVEAGLRFVSSYEYVGFAKKEGSWKSVAATAQADNWNCQQQLDQFKAIRSENNKDIEE